MTARTPQPRILPGIEEAMRTTRVNHPSLNLPTSAHERRGEAAACFLCASYVLPCNCPRWLGSKGCLRLGGAISNKKPSIDTHMPSALVSWSNDDTNCRQAGAVHGKAHLIEDVGCCVRLCLEEPLSPSGQYGEERAVEAFGKPIRHGCHLRTKAYVQQKKKMRK